MKTSFVECVYRKQAQKMCPWASVVVKVTGGYLCFESATDYQTWRKQK